MSRYSSYFLKGAATLLLILLARKAFVDTDLANYDSLAYHLPFAARFWQITTPHQFAFLDHLEPVYRGFPLLGEILQGFLWLFFDHIQAANLLALGSLVLYCWFGRAVLQIPWHLTVLALLAVPLIQIHATASLLDLPANLATAAALLLAYRAFACTEIPPWRDIVVLVVAAGASANIKFLHTGLIALALVAVCVRLAQLAALSEGLARASIINRLFFFGMTAPLVFATALKNTILYKNPLYPIAVGFFGVTLPLPHTVPTRSTFPDYLSAVPQSVIWLLSVFEFRAFDARRPLLWMGDQGYLPTGVPADRMGGYFFVFVIVNLLCFAFLVLRSRSRETRVAGVFFLLLTLITSAHPQSHELRYYMYWIIVLTTLNLHLLVRGHEREDPVFRINAQQFGIVCLITICTVVGLTRGAYIRPLTQPIMIGYTKAIEPAIRAAIEKSPMLCVVGSTNLLFLYADVFHPPLQYSVKAASTESGCGGPRVVVPAR